jgi:hypothetical protein
LAWRGVRAGLVLALCVVCGTAGAVQDSSTSGMVPPTHARGAIAFVQAPVVVAGEWTQRFPQGSQLMRVELGPGAQGAAVSLAAGFFAVGDPQISLDGERVLFSGQVRRGVRWQIFEMEVAGGAVRQVTRCAGDCFQAVYLAGDAIAYSTLSGLGAGREGEIFVSALSGADAHAITFGQGRFEVETALRSGRLLVSRVGVGGRALYLLDPDGSGLMLLRRDGERGVGRGAVELADGAVVFLQRGVGLEWVRQGALRAAVLERGAYASVATMGDGLVVSRGGALYGVDLHGGGREALVYRSARGLSAEAVEIPARTEVLAYPSVLHLERTTGRILCLDAYASENGRLTARVARVRVVAKESRGERVLGEAPVEVDGSFYTTVPADVPIRVELVGTKGGVVKAQRSWMWVRGGEDRGCPGCHESQALAPENRSPMTLQRVDTPSVLVGDAAKVVRR